MKTTNKFNWKDGYTKVKRLSKSFNTIEEAMAFSVGKKNFEIYKSKGKFKVEWLKITFIE